MTLPDRSLTVLIAALGGEGGGVMADWLMDAATASGFPAQATSIPGVAQRTGATTYYLEIFPARKDALDGKTPVFSLTPSPGNVDVMVASELIEAARAMQNGYVTPERSTLIASGHRIYAIENTGERAPWDVDLTGPALFIIGGEARGIPPPVLAAADAVLRIPMGGFIPSYNLQIPVGVVAAERLRQEEKCA